MDNFNFYLQAATMVPPTPINQTALLPSKISNSNNISSFQKVRITRTPTNEPTTKDMNLKSECLLVK